MRGTDGETEKNVWYVGPRVTDSLPSDNRVPQVPPEAQSLQPSTGLASRCSAVSFP